jgi:hypothetical protein
MLGIDARDGRTGPPTKESHMHRCLLATLLVAVTAAAAVPSAADVPTAATLIERAAAASEVESTLAEHNMLRAAIRQEETTSDGTSNVTNLTAVYHGEDLESIRLELDSGISLVLDGETSWAMVRGQLDTRVLAPRMAAGNIRQIVFPLLLPLSLRMDGVMPGAVSEGVFDNQPVWVLEVDFTEDFFVAPSMATTWRVFFSRDEGTVLGAAFLPPESVHAVRDEGVQYTVLSRSEVDGLVLPTQVLLDGIDVNGRPTGHVRVTKVDTVTLGPYDRSIFIHPEEKARIESDEID